MPKNGKPDKVVIGQAYNHLTVLSFSHQDKRWRRHYLCRCRCGVEKTVQGTLLRSGNTKSCGCWAKESARSRCKPHGVASRNQVYAGYRCKANKSGIPFHLTRDQFGRIATQPCFYCGADRSNVHRAQHGAGDFAYNGLDKIDASKGYTINNVVACCRRCNFAKTDRTQGEFIEWIRKAYLHLSRTAMAEQWST